MCFKAGSDELDTVRNLMSMSLSAVISEALEIDIDDIRPTAHFVRDLGMTPEKAQILNEGIAEYFDGLEVDLAATPTVGALLDKVVHSEFRRLEAEAAQASDTSEYREAA